MKLIQTAIPDVILIEPQVFGDERGFFMETWHRDKFQAGGIDAEFVQDNLSRSSRGILRGLHYQIQQPQGKLVRATRGEVFDVAVDLRRSSPTFGQHVAQYLSEENKLALWIPPGFAHGFYVTSDEAEFVYKCSDLYAPQHERSLQWNDPALGIDWPLERGGEPLLSDKDRAALPLSQVDTYP